MVQFEAVVLAFDGDVVSHCQSSGLVLGFASSVCRSIFSLAQGFCSCGLLPICGFMGFAPSSSVILRERGWIEHCEESCGDGCHLRVFCVYWLVGGGARQQAIEIACVQPSFVEFFVVQDAAEERDVGFDSADKVFVEGSDQPR